MTLSEQNRKQIQSMLNGSVFSYRDVGHNPGALHGALAYGDGSLGNICDLGEEVYYKGDISIQLSDELADIIGSNDPKFLTTQHARDAIHAYAQQKEIDMPSEGEQSFLDFVTKFKAPKIIPE